MVDKGKRKDTKKKTDKQASKQTNKFTDITFKKRSSHTIQNKLQTPSILTPGNRGQKSLGEILQSTLLTVNLV